MIPGASRVAALLLTLLFLAPRSSFAELDADASRLVLAWKQQGRVQRLAPRFAERSDPTVVFLPPSLLDGAADGCISVAVLAPSSTHFIVRQLGGPLVPETLEDLPHPSLAGMVQLTRCGVRKQRLAALMVQMRSPRAVVEMVAVKADRRVIAAIDVLPHRDPGPIYPFERPARDAAPPPMSDRLSASEQRARREGAQQVSRKSHPASSRGSGRLIEALEPGCYRIELLAEAQQGDQENPQLSVEPELPEGTALVGVEYGAGRDAVVSLCSASSTQVPIVFVGAPPELAVWSVVSHTPLPAGLSASFGANGQARVAAVLRRHQVRLGGTLVDQALGVQGPTLMPTPVEPGACYVGVLVPFAGQATSLALAASLGSTTAQNHGGPEGDGTLVSFCAREQRNAVIEAESRGTGLVWLFALFQTGRVKVGEELAR